MHERKIVGYLLSGGDADYITGKNGKDWAEVSFKDIDNVYEQIYQNPDNVRDAEHELLMRITLPSDRKSIGAVFDSVSDKHSKRILTYMTNGDWDNYSAAGPTELVEFLQKYPTPMDFEKDAAGFLNMIYAQNGEQKSKQYNQDMDTFCQNVYGKRYEYYKAIGQLHVEADERNRLVHPEKNGEVRESLFKECGGFTINKGDLIGDPDRLNQDAMYVNEDYGVFGVFDGVGGVTGGHNASEKAASIIGSITENYGIGSLNALKNALIFANDGVRDEGGGGATTAVVGQIINDEFGKKLIFGCIGDSRIYIVREGEAYQITTDEGEGRYITNHLGRRDVPSSEVPKQLAEVRLREGDQLVFCSDGITGDKPEDAIPTSEMALIVSSAANPKEAAAALSRRATKIDDRTAVVVKV